VFAEPRDPPDGAIKTVHRIWEKKVDACVKQEDYFEENMKTLCSVIWGQCTDIMGTRLELLDALDAISSVSDALELLKLIKNIVFNLQSQKHKPLALHEAKRRFCVLQQDRPMTAQVFLERFQNDTDVIEHCWGGSIGVEPVLVDMTLTGFGLATTSASGEQMATAGNLAQQRYLACAFLLGSDRCRYGKLLENLENDFLQGRDNYPPENLTSACNLLVNWKQKDFQRYQGPVNDGVAKIEFDHLGGELAAMQIHLNVVSPGEHVPEIERYTRMVKERVRCVHQDTTLQADATSYHHHRDGAHKSFLVECVSPCAGWRLRCSQPPQPCHRPTR
jgi:hypothetical protein